MPGVKSGRPGPLVRCGHRRSWRGVMATLPGTQVNGAQQAGTSRCGDRHRIHREGCMSPTTMPEAGFRTIDGVRIRYIDSGDPQEPVAVLTGPWPESVYAFAPMWAQLSAHACLFAVDLPGFGASDAGMICCRRGRWASSWPSSLPRWIWARRTLSRRMSEPRRPVRGGCTSGADRQRDRGHRRRGRPNRAR